MTGGDPYLCEEVLDVAAAITDQWEQRAGGPYAGLVVDQGAGIVVVCRVSGNDPFDADVLGRASDRVRVVLIDAPPSLAANQEIADSILRHSRLPVEAFVVAPPRGSTSATRVDGLT